MNLAQKVFYSTVAQIGARVVVLAIGLATVRLTATYLGVRSYGQLTIIIALTGLATTVADLGVTTTLAREIAKAPGAAQALGGNLLRFRIGTSIAAALTVAALLPFLPYSHTTKLALAIALAGMAFTILGTFPTAFFQANLRLDIVAAIEVASKTLGLGAILLVRGFGLSFYALVSLLTLVNALACLASFALSRRFWSINLGASWKRVKPVIRDAFWVGLVSTIGLLHFRGDAILLSLLRPAQDVGIYGIAYRFIDQAFMLPGLLVATVFPLITRALHQDRDQAGILIDRTFQVLTLAAVSVTIVLYVLARPLVHLIAGGSFDASVRPLRILAFALIFIFVGPVFYNVLIAINKQRELVAIGLASLALNVGLNLFLIPRYSYNGAATATVISEAFSLLGCFLVARSHYAFRLDRSFLVRALGATLGALLVVVVLSSQSPWVVVVSAELAFCIGAYVSRAVTRADLRLVLRRPQVGP